MACFVVSSRRSWLTFRLSSKPSDDRVVTFFSTSEFHNYLFQKKQPCLYSINTCLHATCEVTKTNNIQTRKY